jgi:hypothetical protein
MKISQLCRLSQEVLSGELLEAVFIDQVLKDPNSKEADEQSRGGQDPQQRRLSLLTLY